MRTTKFRRKIALAPLLCIIMLLSVGVFPPTALAAEHTSSGWNPLSQLASLLKYKKAASKSTGKSLKKTAQIVRNPMADLHPAFDSTMNKSIPTKRLSKLSRHLIRIHSNDSSTNLEEDISQWNIYHDQGFTDGALTSVSDPSTDGNALQVSLDNGQPYAGVHAYRNMAPADNATSFNLDTSFYFTDKTPIQALEFTMNKWVNGQRYEWALQWQVVQDGSPEQGQAQSWRLWNGWEWLNTGAQQTLAPNTWHTLHLSGTIENGKIYYTSFNCDSVETDLTTYSFVPVLSEGDKLAVGVQLDGNAFETPYNLAIENVHLTWA